MTFRGTVVNGVIVPDAGRSLADGMRVEVNLLDQPGRSRKGALGSRRRGRLRSKRSGQQSHPFTALAGIWKDRLDWKGKSSTEVVAELRRRSPGRGRG